MLSDYTQQKDDYYSNICSKGTIPYGNAHERKTCYKLDYSQHKHKAPLTALIQAKLLIEFHAYIEHIHKVVQYQST